MNLPFVTSPYGPTSILELIGAFTTGIAGLLVVLLILGVIFKTVGILLNFIFD